MNDQHTAKVIRLANLTRSDVAELKAILESSGVDLPKQEFQFVDEELTPGRLGEPAALILVASITSLVVGVLGAWLMKKRSDTAIVYTIEVDYTDGTKRVSKLEIKQSTSDPPSEEVLKQLATITHFPIEQTKALMK